ncbi:LysR family transcriptional regulator [Alteribacillus iranensis]|uniref:DNA-binding transcriptional regulator, LysR family n=1 Tax=Alteribacillus iranensis TaxID=930128 RepID=A0A1I2AGB4_9BACI|nr:LysR family transcriptional regulator [Alteribacillus iranensis]SFE43054.1 DNA-binding transcriptional regulator, LysR family [Alteribacillus iranensis]
MDIKQLMYFQEVAELGSFTRAAEKLHIAQPAISKAIKNLENELDCMLFIREKRHVYLTAEGRILKKHADQLIKGFERAKNELQDVKAGILGTVQLGLPSMVGSYYFPEKLARFKKKNPSFAIDLYEAGSTDLGEAIIDGEMEMGTVVVSEGMNDMLQIHPFLEEPLMLVVPPNHHLAEKRSVPLSQLAHEPLILFKEGYYQRKVIEEAGELAGQSPKIAFETNQISMAKSLTARGFGVSVFLKMVVPEKEEDLVAIPFDPPIVLTLGIAHKKNVPLSPANKAFLNFLMDETTR